MLNIKKELANLAKQKGFVAKMINPTEHEWYAKSLEGDRWWLWLCSLRRWLRDYNNIGVFTNWGYHDNPHWGVNIYYLNEKALIDNPVKVSGIDFEPKLFETEEDALAKGLLEALKLI